MAAPEMVRDDWTQTATATGPHTDAAVVLRRLDANHWATPRSRGPEVPDRSSCSVEQTGRGRPTAKLSRWEFGAQAAYLFDLAPGVPLRFGPGDRRVPG